MTCLQCGGGMPPRQPTAGRQPRFCSDECRKTRKRQTYRKWATENRARWRKYRRPDFWKDFYAANRERRKKKSNEWYHANTERAEAKRKVYVARRRETHLDHLRAIGRKNRQKRRAVELQAFVEVVDPLVVFERDKGVCMICSLPVDRAGAWEIDHKVPLSKGGEHSYANTQLAHRSCNRSKGARVAS